MHQRLGEEDHCQGKRSDHERPNRCQRLAPQRYAPRRALRGPPPQQLSEITSGKALDLMPQNFLRFAMTA